jgi:hypothetical protein
VLFSSYSDDPMFGFIAQAHAAINNYWVSFAVPAQCSPGAPSGLVAPGGIWLDRCVADGAQALVVIDLDREAPQLDVPIHKARPWRRTARAGGIYADRQVQDPRSEDRTTL